MPTPSSFRRRTASLSAAVARFSAHAALLAALALAACAGGDKSLTEPGNPLTPPPSGSDPTTPATGVLSVVPTGLPGSVNSRVTIRSGTVEHVVVGAGSVAGLAPGVWNVAADDVTVAGVTYVPTPATQTATVAASTTATVRVDYAPSSGTLVMTITGLPTGAGGDVVVTGADGVSRPVSTSSTLPALPPGRYHVAARPVRLASGNFAPDVAAQDVDVVAGTVPATITVAYAPAPAVVSVAIAGLPAGASAAVSLTRPAGAAIAVTASTTLSAALAGRWQLAAAVVHFAGSTWTPSPAARDTVVIAGDSLAFSVLYTLSTGSLAVTVAGLPGGVSGLVNVTGPSGFLRTLIGTTTITDLAPGTYTIMADSLQSDGIAYRAAAAVQQVAVQASPVAASATVSYSAAVASLTVGLAGVPIGVTNVVEVTGPAGFNRAISGTTTFPNIAPGTYTITATDIVLPGGVRYQATPTATQRTIGYGAADSVGITYARAVGRLQITVIGLPAGTLAGLTLTGNGVVTPVTSSVLLDNLAPGTYTLTGAIVSTAGVQYTPTPVSATIIVTNGGTASTTVTYSVNSPNGPQLNLVMDGFYLTQAVQRMDNSVPLVAGRDALLRVFVHGTIVSAAQPVVRVRVYDGTTLLQTLLLNAPESAVRTTLAEGTLASTWNTVVAGANVRPSMRVAVDVDPASAIIETDEGDNAWPRTGTPQAIAVNVVPTFNVRFVPVTVGTLTGNVTAANKEQFLVSTRRMHPINDIASDVRAPFTSSATLLQSNDGNGGWGTVLSELSALRTADGAPANLHYFGVVKVGYTSGIAGYGYVPGRTAMGWDYLPSGDGVAVHEWGHNFGRPHTACGGASDADAAYPYTGGTIGVWGWNPSTGTLVSPLATDVMGYCSNQWTSDWTWTRVMAYRANSSLVAAATVTGGRQEGLLVWGRVVNGKVILEPAFRVNSRPSAIAASGTHRLQALDTRGALLLDLPLAIERIDHAFDRDEGQFAMVVPWSARLERALATIRVIDARQPLAAASLTSAATTVAAGANPQSDSVPVVLPDAGAQLSTLTGGRARVQWSTRAYRMVMARDRDTGQIMAFVRNSGESINTGGRNIELVFSDGVRSRVERGR